MRSVNRGTAVHLAGLGDRRVRPDQPAGRNELAGRGTVRCRMLCADDGASLSAAIFDYNHASWHVSELPVLASEYAREYP